MCLKRRKEYQNSICLRKTRETSIAGQFFGPFAAKSFDIDGDGCRAFPEFSSMATPENYGPKQEVIDISHKTFGGCFWAIHLTSMWDNG